jgi:hypothetical protein
VPGSYRFIIVAAPRHWRMPAASTTDAIARTGCGSRCSPSIPPISFPAGAASSMPGLASRFTEAYALRISEDRR